MKQTKFKEFLDRKGVEITFKKYGLEVLSSMALGLFATLLVGTILNTIGDKFGITYLTETIWPAARDMTGAAIGVAIANTLNAPALVLYAAVVVGYLGNTLGGPLGCLIATCFGVEFGKMVSKETKLDIIVTPAVTIIIGSLIASLFGPILAKGMSSLGSFIMKTTELKPFFMGIIVSVIVGMVLTLPISSAALCMMIGLSGLAGGAATAGCSAQMVGFAVMSYRENGIEGLVSQGLGTSMLQIPNIVKNWKIWIPPTLASAITGPISTVVFKMTNLPIGSGMGTSGLVGQICTVTSMTEAGVSAATIYSGILIVHILLPAVLSVLFYNILKKVGWIKDGDLKLNF
ncbi:MAG: PTS sugar transporter subunit IIC [Ezakiella sp.]|nr:PTS sugar transporter subunit IIC [Ezakiella sp.]MDD7472224.1 PTS sugar transporter subunit IIC [Bacillota bacterium]MDY3923217.1 PTS sugar transporter subunit IIC [Ezakiella sp.]